MGSVEKLQKFFLVKGCEREWFLYSNELSPTWDEWLQALLQYLKLFTSWNIKNFSLISVSLSGISSFFSSNILLFELVTWKKKFLRSMLVNTAHLPQFCCDYVNAPHKIMWDVTSNRPLDNSCCMENGRHPTKCICRRIPWILCFCSVWVLDYWL